MKIRMSFFSFYMAASLSFLEWSQLTIATFLQAIFVEIIFFDPLAYMCSQHLPSTLHFPLQYFFDLVWILNIPDWQIIRGVPSKCELDACAGGSTLAGALTNLEGGNRFSPASPSSPFGTLSIKKLALTTQKRQDSQKQYSEYKDLVQSLRLHGHCPARKLEYFT